MALGYRVEGLGLGTQGLGLRGWDLRFGVSGRWLPASASRIRIPQVQGLLSKPKYGVGPVHELEEIFPYWVPIQEYTKDYEKRPLVQL